MNHVTKYKQKEIEPHFHAITDRQVPYKCQKGPNSRFWKYQLFDFFVFFLDALVIYSTKVSKKSLFFWQKAFWRFFGTTCPNISRTTSFYGISFIAESIRSYRTNFELPTRRIRKVVGGAKNRPPGPRTLARSSSASVPTPTTFCTVIGCYLVIIGVLGQCQSHSYVDSVLETSNLKGINSFHQFSRNIQ